MGTHMDIEYSEVGMNIYFLCPQLQFHNLKEALPQSQFRTMQADKPTDKQVDKQTGRQTDRQAGGQAEKPTGRPADRQKDG
jgi:hypothetical protein